MPEWVFEAPHSYMRGLFPYSPRTKEISQCHSSPTPFPSPRQRIPHDPTAGLPRVLVARGGGRQHRNRKADSCRRPPRGGRAPPPPGPANGQFVAFRSGERPTWTPSEIVRNIAKKKRRRA